MKKFLQEYWVPLAFMVGCWIISVIIMLVAVHLA